MKLHPLRRGFCLAGLLLVAFGRAQADDSADEAFVLQEGAYIAQHYVEPPIKWAPCGPAAALLECGSVTVPIDYRRPGDGTLELAVLRAKASQPWRRLGTLVVTHGGPSGRSSVDLLANSLARPDRVRLRERFDLVSFDARGTGRSRPVQCVVTPAGRPPEQAANESLVTFFDDFARRLADACLQQNGPFLTKVGTNNVARDLDVLRRALGERQISFYGPSYSSMVGAVYASLFPQHVRAMVLDGVRAPETRDYVMETVSETFAGSELALHRVEQLCRASPACLLRTAGVTATMDRVLARLRAAPVVSPDGKVLDAAVFQTLVDTQLLTEANWPNVVQGITAANAGRFEMIFAFVDPPSAVVEASLGGLILNASRFDAFTAVSCLDYGSRHGAASYLAYDEAFASLHRRLFARFDVAATTAMCAAWPAADLPVITRIKGRVANPVLLLGNQFDNRTSLSWARSMARTLGMERSLVHYEGGGHTAYGKGIGCIDALVEQYLFDLRLPPEGFGCAARPVVF